MEQGDSGTRPLLDPDGIARLREALRAAGYTSAGVSARIGAEATASARRHDFRAALRETVGAADPLATLVRMLVCGQSEPAGAVATALHPLGLDDAYAAGLIEHDGGGVRAAIDLEPYGEDWWILSDLSAGAWPGP